MTNTDSCALGRCQGERWRTCHGVAAWLLAGLFAWPSGPVPAQTPTPSASVADSPLESAQPSEAPPVSFELEAVTVVRLQDPVSLRYQRLLQGLDAFDAHHARAPAATAQFKLLLRPGLTDPNAADLALRLSSQEGARPIELDAQHRFVAQRGWASADDAQARLVANRTLAQYNLMPHIRSEGIDPAVRRLGDLRLQCEVGWAMVKDDLSFLRRAFLATLGGACSSRLAKVGFRAPQRLAAVSLVVGTRRETLLLRDIRAQGWGGGFKPEVQHSVYQVRIQI